MTHIMLDLETWGTAPGCALRSIGAVAFSYSDPKMAWGKLRPERTSTAVSDGPSVEL